MPRYPTQAEIESAPPHVIEHWYNTLPDAESDTERQLEAILCQRYNELPEHVVKQIPGYWIMGLVLGSALLGWFLRGC